jgi:hypothetical protein
VYTGLRTSSLVDEEEPGGAKARRPAAPASSPEHHVPALAALDEIDRLVLLGDPGSGKSTFVSFVALCLAAEGLGRKEIGLKALTRPLSDEEDSGGVRPDGGGARRRSAGGTARSCR